MSDALYRGNISIGATDDTQAALTSMIANFKQSSDQLADALSKGMKAD